MSNTHVVGPDGDLAAVGFSQEHGGADRRRLMLGELGNHLDERVAGVEDVVNHEDVAAGDVGSSLSSITSAVRRWASLRYWLARIRATRSGLSRWRIRSASITKLPVRMPTMVSGRRPYSSRSWPARASTPVLICC